VTDYYIQDLSFTVCKAGGERVAGYTSAAAMGFDYAVDEVGRIVQAAIDNTLLPAPDTTALRDAGYNISEGTPSAKK
jgi:hypothetical protein